MTSLKALLAVCFAGVCMSGFFLWLVNQGDTAAVVALTANALMWVALILWSNLWWVRQQ